MINGKHLNKSVFNTFFIIWKISYLIMMLSLFIDTGTSLYFFNKTDGDLEQGRRKHRAT